MSVKSKLHLMILSAGGLVVLVIGAGLVTLQNRGGFQESRAHSIASDQEPTVAETEAHPGPRPADDGDVGKTDLPDRVSLSDHSDTEPLPPAPDAEQAWRGVHPDDLVSLRRYLLEFGDGAHAPEARARIRQMDDASRERVSASDGLMARIAAAQEYVENFPDGAWRAEVSGLLASDRQDLAEAIGWLQSQGGFEGEDAPSDQMLRRAIEVFQESAGLERSGDLDTTTLGRLKALADPANRQVVLPVEIATVPEASEALREEAPADEDTRPEIEAEAPFRDCPVCPQVMKVPAGGFLMGDLSGDGDPDELPVRKVAISPSFAIGIYEVTFDEWGACVADGACAYLPDDMGWGRGRRPVMNISKSDTDAYLTWLSDKTGYRYRLPSEAEWEYAARAGSHASHIGRTGDDICQYANAADASSNYRWRNQLCEDGFPDRPAPAGSFSANEFGLHDMMGNVWEWVADCWHDGYAMAHGNGAAWTEDCDKQEHILRGGAFSVDQSKLRVSYRYSFSDKRLPFFGFRVVRENP